MRFNWDAAKYSTISGVQAEVGHMLIDALQLQAHENVLDLGCGTGNLTIELAARCKAGFILGVDASPAMIEQAQARSIGHTNVEFRVQDAAGLQFQQEFDVVFSNSALHWLARGDQVLASLASALRPGGRVGLQFPLLNERHPLVASARQVLRTLDLERYYQGWTFPWFVTTVPEYTRLLRDAGYQNISVQEVQTPFRFQSSSQAYDFLDTVGIGLYLAPLDADQAQRFGRELQRVLERATTADGICFQFERLFAFGSIP